MKLLLDCRALARLLSESQDAAPRLAAQARICLHLATCKACRNVDEQMRFVRTAMQGLPMNPTSDNPFAEQSE